MPTLPDVASATLLLNLQADALVLADGDPVSAWANAGTLGGSFTQTGSARPTKQTIGGSAVVVFDGVDDWMQASSAINAGLNNLASFTVFVVVNPGSQTGGSAPIILKYQDGDSFNGAGWSLGLSYPILSTNDAGGIHYQAAQIDRVPADEVLILTGERISASETHFYINSDSTGEHSAGSDTIPDFQNTSPVQLGADTVNSIFAAMPLSAVMAYAPAPNASDRAAIEAWLRGKYGSPITLLQMNAVAYWPMAEASATRYDVTGRGNHLTEVHGLVGSAAGTSGDGASFITADGHYLQAASTADLTINTTQSYTLTLWVKLLLNQQQTLVSKGAGGVSEFHLYWDGASFWFVYNGTPVTLPTTYSATDFFFLEASFDVRLQTVRLQVNNADFATASGSAASGGAGALSVGGDATNDPANPDVADAIIDQIGVWRRILTATERAQLSAGAVWPFTDSITFFRATTDAGDLAGTVAYDVSSYVVTSCTIDNTHGASVLTVDLYKVEGNDLILWQAVVVQPGATVTRDIAAGLLIGLDVDSLPSASSGNMAAQATF